MEENCLPKIVRDNRPQGVGSWGRRKERWKPSSFTLKSRWTGISLEEEEGEEDKEKEGGGGGEILYCSIAQMWLLCILVRVWGKYCNVFLSILCYICKGNMRERKLLSMLLYDADYTTQATSTEVSCVCEYNYRLRSLTVLTWFRKKHSCNWNSAAWRNFCHSI